MKTNLIHLAIRGEIGLAIDEHEVAVSQTAMTPTGWVEVVKDRTAYEPDGLAPAVQELLARHFTRHDLESAKVIVGLPTLRVFFSTRPIQAANLQASPEVLLHEVIQSPTLSVDDMMVDLLKAKPGLRPLASIASCRRKYLSGVLSALASCGVVPIRAEPSPCGLLREAGRKHRPPRKSQVYLRVFLGKGEGLAVLLAAPELPLMWRPFALPERGEAESILATVASLRIMGSYCGLDAEADAVLIHGRADLGDLAELAASPALGGMRVLRHDEPGLDAADVASGLVLSPKPGVETFNLVRSIARRTSFRELFPWGQAALQVAVLLAATSWLGTRLRGHRAAAEAVRAEDAKYAWAAKIPAEKLRIEKKEEEQKIAAIRSFAETRIPWTAYTNDVAAKLPPDLGLLSLQGVYELEPIGGKGGGQAKKSLLLSLTAPLTPTGAMPREIDTFLQGLRGDPLLKKTFPEIKMTGLQRTQGTASGATASFSVNCQPPKAAPAAPRAATKGKGK